jgi:hypothetical protein
MATNLVPSVMYENDLPSSEFTISDDSFPKSKTIDTMITLVDVVFENIPKTPDLDRHMKSKKLQLTNELDEVYDGDTVSSSSSGCVCCTRIPATPTSDVSASEPLLVDVSVDSVDPNIFYHPLAQCMDNESEPYIKNLNSFNSLTNTISSAKSSVKLRNVAADQSSYTTLRITYLLVTLVIMLADGLQGKSLQRYI